MFCQSFSLTFFSILFVADIVLSYHKVIKLDNHWKGGGIQFIFMQENCFNSIFMDGYNQETLETYTATVSLGQEDGYTQRIILGDDYIHAIQAYQHDLRSTKEIYLSVSISESRIILGGQNEPHIRLEIINYPRFPLKQEVFKSEVIAMVDHLMETFHQNRTVIVFTDETVMLQKTEEVDPRIESYGLSKAKDGSSEWFFHYHLL